MRAAFAGLAVLLALLSPRTGHAQHRDQLLSFPAVESPATRVTGPVALRVAVPEQGGGAHDVWLVLGGAAGGTLGFFGGAIIGSVLDGPPDPDCIDFCFGDGLIPGALIGEAVGLALGVHLANGRRGSLPMGMLASAGVLALGVTGMLEEPQVVFLVPVGQIVGAAYAERRTARRRAARGR
jgi:hypothetical protein